MRWTIGISLVVFGVVCATAAIADFPRPAGWERPRRSTGRASGRPEAGQPSPPPARSEAAHIDDVEAAYLRGEYALAINLGQRYLQADASGPAGQDQLWYLIGMAQLQLQQPEEARRTFEQMLDRYPDSRWRPDAEAGAADAVWMADDPARAVTLYQAILARWGPEHPIALRLQYQLGQAARQAGQWTVARQAFEALVAKAPASFEAGLARAVLQEAEFTFSIQVGAFGVRDNAVRLQRQLSQRGYDAMVDRTLADGRVLHRVRVGRFASRDQASQTAARLRQDGFPSKVVP